MLVLDKLTTCKQQSEYVTGFHMKKLMLFTLLTGFGATCQAQFVMFLEEKTAFCYSESALSKYYNFARKRKLEGMNMLVLNGKCDFVPDGEVIRLKNYQIETIGRMKAVEFKIDNIPVWTIKTLVQTTDFNNL